MKNLIDRLSIGLSQTLPGKPAQFRMAHAIRRPDAEVPPDARRAAVLALFYPKESQWHIALIERSRANPHDRHSGQISFPGGRFDAKDQSLTETALRESEEEIGILRKHVQILGALTDLYIPVSNFHVFPFVGYMDRTPVLTPQAGEVEAIVEAPFSCFLEKSGLQHADISFGAGMILPNVPCFEVQGHIVWGATAMIMSELLALLE
jgi:8-oxo-dGTP pyrophosphatase MutT (NUDIX family)